jgi:hypothetical protein
MDPHGKFLPPQNEEEFAKRAQDITLPAATSILSSLKERRKALVANIDAEIAFYEKVVKLKDAGED